MITHNTMYDFHNVELKTRLESVKEEIKELKERQILLINYFKSDLCVKKLIDIKELDKLEVFINPITNPEKYYNLKVIQYKELVKLLNNKLDLEKKLLKYKIPQSIFSYILKRFNELLYEEMVYRKYEFRTLYLGGFYVICNKNKNKVINWHKSIINKNKLLAEGKVPYTKQAEKEAKEKGLDYKAEQWLEYLSDYSFFFHWDLSNSQFIRIPNINNFTFIPVRGERSPVSTLVAFKNSFKSEEEAINFYKK